MRKANAGGVTYVRDCWTYQAEQEIAEDLARSQGTTLQPCPKPARPLLCNPATMRCFVGERPCGRVSCAPCRLRWVARWLVEFEHCFPLAGGAYVTQVPDAKVMNRVGQYLRSHGGGYFTVPATNGARVVVSTVVATPSGRAPASRWLAKLAVRQEVESALLASTEGRPRWSKTLQPRRQSEQSEWILLVPHVEGDVGPDDVAAIMARVDAECRRRFGAVVIWPGTGVGTDTPTMIVGPRLRLPPGLGGEQFHELLRTAARATSPTRTTIPGLGPRPRLLGITDL